MNDIEQIDQSELKEANMIARIKKTKQNTFRLPMQVLLPSGHRQWHPSPLKQILSLQNAGNSRSADSGSMKDILHMHCFTCKVR